MRIPLTICGLLLQFTDSTYNLRIPQQLNVILHMSYYFFVDSTNCSGLRKYSSGLERAKNIKEKWQCCGFRDKSDFGLLRYPFTMHSLASL